MKHVVFIILVLAMCGCNKSDEYLGEIKEIRLELEKQDMVINELASEIMRIVDDEFNPIYENAATISGIVEEDEIQEMLENLEDKIFCDLYVYKED